MPSVQPRFLDRLYPEIAAGGFSRVDGTVAFYSRVNALLHGVRPDCTLLDFGAGRGQFLGDPVEFRRNLRLFRGKAGRVIGVDVDEAVRRNLSLDEAFVVDSSHPLPLEDGSVDIVVADFVFEHVTEPLRTSEELDRVLRDDGWLCVRTPNRHGYIGIGGRLVPNHLHSQALRRLQPTKEQCDTFDTAYLLNTRADLRRWFSTDRYRHIVWIQDSEPLYVGHSAVAAWVNRAVHAITPPPCRSILYGFLQKTSGRGALG